MPLFVSQISFVRLGLRFSVISEMLHSFSECPDPYRTSMTPDNTDLFRLGRFRSHLIPLGSF